MSPPSNLHKREIHILNGMRFYQLKMAGSFLNDVISSVLRLKIKSYYDLG